MTYNTFIEPEIQLEYDYYKTILQLNLQLRKIKHDMVNHLTILSIMTEENNQAGDKYKVQLLSACENIKEITRNVRKQNDAYLDRRKLQRDHINDMLSFNEEALQIAESVEKLCGMPTVTADGIKQSQAFEEKCIEDCDGLIRKNYSGKTVVNALLYNKCRICENLGIDFYSEIQELPENGLSEPEMISLMSNLLDNAIEAASAKNTNNGQSSQVTDHAPSNDSFVSITSVIIKGEWLLKVGSSESHVLDTKIIKQIVDYHGGSIKTNDNKDTFQTTISILAK